MTHKYYHIGIIGASNSSIHLTQAIGLIATDYLYYSPVHWILWSDKSTITLSEVIKASLPPGGMVLIVEINMQTRPTGYMPQAIWDWINKPRFDNVDLLKLLDLPPPATSN